MTEWLPVEVETRNNLDFADRTMQDGWIQTQESEHDRPPVINQVEFVGPLFHRHSTPNQPLTKQSRRTRIIGQLDTQTGLNIFRPAHTVHCSPSLLPHLSIRQAEKQDLVQQGSPRLSTARKKGASQSYANPHPR